MQLHDTRIECPGERRYPLALVRGHGHHHVLGLELALSRRDTKSPVFLPEPVHLDPSPHGQVEMCRVGLKVPRHLILGGKRVGTLRVGHACEPVIPSRSEKAERVPAVSPGVTNSFVSLEDHEGQPTACQMVTRREARLASADDEGLDTLWLAHPFTRVSLR